MSTKTPQPGELAEVIKMVVKASATYLDSINERPARDPDFAGALSKFDGNLPDAGTGAAAALRKLIDDGLDASVASAGPRCFHFVIGGTTPAALGADWLATTLDQIAYAYVSSPLGVKLEVHALSMLKSLFGLPSEWSGVFTTGATMANFTGLSAARQWCGQQHGVDVAEDGLGLVPRVPVFSSGYIHASAVKALAMAGLGRSSVQTFTRDAAGRADLDAMEKALKNLNGAPAIIIGNAGEVNMGDFDPIDRLADLAHRYNAWLHVDGAFGLFAALSPRTEKLVKGVDRAHSVTVDGHKWLNVPYDCGFAFVKDHSLLARTYAYSAAYLPHPDDPEPNMGTIGPESSRRARSLPVWATLQAYGRRGYRDMVERHLDLAQHLANLIDESPEFERLAEVPLNIVCFRFNPGGLSEAELNVLNARLGEAVLTDGRFYVGTTTFEGKTAFRPAIVNWRTRESDIEAFVDVVRELGERLAVRD
jgi:glutamate/tyrosine decarboxylase-like PLP-dependent enzyme